MSEFKAVCSKCGNVFIGYGDTVKLPIMCPDCEENNAIEDRDQKWHDRIHKMLGELYDEKRLPGTGSFRRQQIPAIERALRKLLEDKQ